MSVIQRHKKKAFEKANKKRDNKINNKDIYNFVGECK